MVFDLQAVRVFPVDPVKLLSVGNQEHWVLPIVHSETPNFETYKTNEKNWTLMVELQKPSGCKCENYQSSCNEKEKSNYNTEAILLSIQRERKGKTAANFHINMVTNGKTNFYQFPSSSDQRHT